MNKRILFLLLSFPAFSFGKVESGVVAVENVITNKYIVSNVIERKRWERTAIMADKDDKLKDPTGQFVDYSDAVAVQYTADHIGDISTGAMEAVSNSVQRINGVTNQIPDGAFHVAVSIPRQDEENFSSRVEDEGTVGFTDWQVVRFSSLLSVPPNRHIIYRYSGGEVSVPVQWVTPWDATSYTHKCEIPRPTIFNNISATFKSRTHDILGGKKGFSFGTSIVKVNGSPAFTGSITNRTTGAVLTFKSGVLQQ